MGPKVSGRTRYVAITSGKGGVGKSTISANLALLLAQSGVRVALFDADIGLANLDVMLDVEAELTMLDVLKGNATIDDILVPVRPGLVLIPGESGEEIFRYTASESFSRLLTDAGALDDIDVLLIDTGAGIAEETQRFLRAADEVLIVTVPDPAALTDAYATLKVTARHCGRIGIVLNQVRERREAEEIFKRLVFVARTHLERLPELELAGAIYKDEKIAQAVKRRRCFMERHPRSQGARALTEIAQYLLLHVESPASSPAQHSGLSGFFRRLAEQF